MCTSFFARSVLGSGLLVYNIVFFSVLYKYYLFDWFCVVPITTGYLESSCLRISAAISFSIFSINTPLFPGVIFSSELHFITFFVCRVAGNDPTDIVR